MFQAVLYGMVFVTKLQTKCLERIMARNISNRNQFNHVVLFIVNEYIFVSLTSSGQALFKTVRIRLRCSTFIAS